MTGILLLSMMLSTGVGGSGGASVLFADGRPLVPLSVMELGDDQYYKLSEIASALGGSFSWTPARRRAVMHIGEDSVAVTADSPFFAINGRGFHMPRPVLYRTGFMWAPSPFLGLLTQQLGSVRATWDDSTGCLFVAQHNCDVHLVDLVYDSLSTSVELSIPSQATWHLSPFSGDSVTLTIHGGIICSDEIDSLVPDRPIRRITSRQVFAQAVIVLHLVDADLAVRASQPYGSGLLELSIEPPLDLVQEPPEEFVVRRILIDPGHGGDDSGAVSRDGVLEKDVTLSLALLTARTLRRRLKDVEVLLTREDDAPVRLVRRVEMANSLNADLFVSVHCNSSFNRSLKGLQVFFLSPSTTKRARAVAALENAVMALDERDSAASSSEGPFALWDIVQNRWLSHSRQLAAALTEAASRRLDTEIHDAAQASLFVLNGATMPAVLLEVGYLSNPREARKLRDSGYLEQIALALSEGIERFIEGLDSREEPVE